MRDVLSFESRYEALLTGTCTVCLRPCDTLTGLKGDTKWLLGGLCLAGIPQLEARAMIADWQGVPNGYHRPGIHTLAFRFCAACAEASAWPVPLSSAGAGVIETLVDGRISTHKEPL